MHNGITKGQMNAAEQLVARILNAGYRISVHDGEAWSIKRSDNYSAILDAMGETDADTLRLTKIGNVVGEGNIVLVWGNEDDGSDLISDYGPADGPIDELIRAHWKARGDL